MKQLILITIIAAIIVMMSIPAGFIQNQPTTYISQQDTSQHKEHGNHP